KSGIRPDELLKAIKFAPRPTNKTELKSYLGLINFYCHFVKNLSGKLVPLYELTKEGKQWEWSKECESIFKDSKTWICSSDVLALYDPTKKLRLTFLLVKLSSAEKNYAQIEREALAIVFGLKKYHNYLFGRRLELVTDHSPLTIIFGKKKNVSVTAAVRLQRWAILLSAYDYQIVYKKGADIPNADALSRLPLPDDTELELKYILDLLHQRHQGIVRIKALARSFVWWPTLDNQIEDQVKQCSSCQSQSNSGRVTPVYWPLTHRRWQRVHMDLAQIYYKVMGTVTSPDIITKVRSLVAAYGLMEEVVSDKGPQFCSQLIENFFEKNAIKHILIPLYHVNSNGAAEWAVQNIKAVIKRSLQDQPSSFQNLQHIIDNYLMVYRNTPHTVTGRTPAEMFLGRRHRTRLSILQPNLAEHVEKKRAATTPVLIRVKTYDEGEKVWVRSVRGEEVKWFPGVVTKIKSLQTCLVRVNGFTRFVHVDYLKPGSTSELPQMGTKSNPVVNINPPSLQGSVVQPEVSEPPPQSNMQTTTSDVQPPSLPLTNSEPT
ncbi:hypothetical protein ILUMI_05426, partial [Ignelater luminosus]